jgi:hypothetical protein
MDSFDPNIKQNTPSGDGVDVTTLVKNDLEARSQAGEKKYGTRLKTNNGRNAMVDAYQEVLDLACYLRQMIEEQVTEHLPSTE